MSNSLDPDQDRQSVGIHLGSNCLQKAIGRRQNYPLACKELKQVNTLVFSILSHIGSFQLGYTCIRVYHKYSGTLNTFDMLCPLSKAKVIFKGSSLNQFYFPMLNWALSFLQRCLFILLSFQFCIIYDTCSQKCTGNF